MDFIDLKAQQKRIRSQLNENIDRVLDHGRYIMGPEIEQLESRLSDFSGVKHALGCASGTDALLMALMAYDVGPGDAIITTPFTFIATAEVICLLGAVPVFVDIDSKTFNMDPNQIETLIETYEHKRKSKQVLRDTQLKGIIAVDLFGLPADYDRINAIARQHNLFVIEDAAQSFGGEYNGKRVGSLADIACTSFFPAKPLGCYGDGGMCFTDDAKLAEAMDSIRVHGKGQDKYDNVRVGINGRLDTLQAAILMAKFDIFPEEIELRQQVADSYERLLSKCDDIVLPKIPKGYKSVWAQYSILAADASSRSRKQDALKKEGIPTAIYYPKPLHLQTAFSSLGYGPGDFPVSEDFAARIFSVPMHPYLSVDDQKKIADVLSA